MKVRKIDLSKFGSLGGQDVDGRIMNYVINKFKESTNHDISNFQKLIKKLRNKCRQAKEAFSFNVDLYNIHVCFYFII